MSAIDTETLLSQLRWRYATKQFDPQRATKEKLVPISWAALLGVDTCPMEGLDPAAYDKALGVEGSGFWTVADCPAGYRAQEDKQSALPKVRFSKEEIINLP